MEFRKDINGLRAIAVLGVALYHFGAAGVSGGYAGVDVFFVISGFLMTGIILTGLRQKRFSLQAFYLSRARRIVPALVVVCLVLLVFGYFWFIPSDYKTLGKHVMSSLLFVSNFVFQGEEGYFDAPSRDKWMLHTWSLSVEWQFYLLYPLCLMAGHKFLSKAKSRYLQALAVAGLMSLAASVAVTPFSSSFSFYLLPARIWEFMAGGIACLLPPVRKPSAAAAEAGGLALILFSYLFFGNETPWPGYAAVAPVLGTALVILAARDNSLVTANPAAQLVGKWSYSIYLWHWPLVVALSYFGLAGPAWACFGFLASIALGAASCIFIEEPFRQKKPPGARRSRLVVAGAAAAFALCLSAAIFRLGGLEARVSPAIMSIEHAAENHYKADGKCGFDKASVTLTRCHVGDPDTTGFAIWGDSHAGAIVDAVAAAAKEGGLIYSQSCPTIFNTQGKSKPRNYHCPEFNELAFHDIQSLPPRVPVIIANRFSLYILGFNEGVKKTTGLNYYDVPPGEVARDETGVFQRKLTASLCTIAKARKTYVVEPIPEMGRNVPKTMARSLMAGRAVPDMSISRADYDARHKIVMDALHQARDRCGVTLLDPTPYLCHDGRCYGTSHGQPIYFDDDHLNALGDRLITPMFSVAFR